PRAAITTVWGTGSTRSAQMRAMPAAHAQASYFRSTRTASLASWGVGIVVQEVSTTARMTSTNKSDLNSASGLPGPGIEPALWLNLTRETSFRLFPPLQL